LFSYAAAAGSLGDSRITLQVNVAGNAGITR
jgi:hypothetical protein